MTVLGADIQRHSCRKRWSAPICRFLRLMEVMDLDHADYYSTTGQAAVDSITLSDDRFDVILDPEDGLWLKLKDDQMPGPSKRKLP